MYLAFRFETKLTILVATNGVARVLTTKYCETILRLCFLLDHAFGHAPRATLSPLLPLGQNFAPGKKPQVEIVTAFSSLVAETFFRLDSCLHFPISLTVEGGCWCVFDVPFLFYGNVSESVSARLAYGSGHPSFIIAAPSPRLLASHCMTSSLCGL